jgi:hypothetical protein
MRKVMRKVWILSAVLASLSGTAALAQSQDGPTLGGHIGFVLPLVTRVGGQTINNTADQFSIGFPVGITVKGSGRLAFDLELDPFINTTGTRQTTLNVAPGLVYRLGHGWAAGMRLSFNVNNSAWGFVPLVNHSWPIKRENSFFKSYFIEGDFPVTFNRPINTPATNAFAFAMHFGVGF